MAEEYTRWLLVLSLPKTKKMYKQENQIRVFCSRKQSHYFYFWSRKWKMLERSEKASECMANISLSLFAFNIAVYIVTGVDARNIIINISFHVMKLRNSSSKSIKFFSFWIMTKNKFISTAGCGGGCCRSKGINSRFHLDIWWLFSRIISLIHLSKKQFLC